ERRAGGADIKASNSTTASTRSQDAVRKRSNGLVSSGPINGEAKASGDRTADRGSGSAGPSTSSRPRARVAAAATRSRRDRGVFDGARAQARMAPSDRAVTPQR